MAKKKTATKRKAKKATPRKKWAEPAVVALGESRPVQAGKTADLAKSAELLGEKSTPFARITSWPSLIEPNRVRAVVIEATGRDAVAETLKQLPSMILEQRTPGPGDKYKSDKAESD